MSIFRRIALIGAALLLVAVGYVAYQFVAAGLRIAHHAEAEYPTARVIREVTAYVEANQGAWPGSWEEIGVTDEETQSRVVIRFDITSEQLLAESSLIHEVIHPVTGEYRVYPHAERDLEHLLDTIRSAQKEPEED